MFDASVELDWNLLPSIIVRGSEWRLWLREETRMGRRIGRRIGISYEALYCWCHRERCAAKRALPLLFFLFASLLCLTFLLFLIGSVTHAIAWSGVRSRRDFGSRFVSFVSGSCWRGSSSLANSLSHSLANWLLNSFSSWLPHSFTRSLTYSRCSRSVIHFLFARFRSVISSLRPFNGEAQNAVI